MRRKPASVWTNIFVAASCAAFFSAPAAHASNLLKSDFEAGNYSTYGWYYSGNNSIKMVSSPVCGGRYAARVPLNYSDPVSFRTELALGSPGPSTFSAGTNYWLGMAVYLSDWKPDHTDDILLQFHDTPDAHLGEDWRWPPLALIVNGNDLVLYWAWDAKKVSGPNGGIGGSARRVVGKWASNRWMSFVMNFRFGYHNDGMIRLWQNGQLIADLQNISVGYNDETGHFFKVGNYKSAWRTSPSAVSSRLHYMDEIRIGNASSSYSNVAPPCGPGGSAAGSSSSVSVPGGLQLRVVPLASEPAPAPTEPNPEAESTPPQS